MGLDRIFGLNHTVVVAVSAVLHVAILVAMYRLLLLLFGNRRAVLGLLVAFGCSTLWLSGYLWWVSAFQVLPGILFTVIAIDAFVRHQVFGGPRYALLTAGSLASALLFYEKPLQLSVLLPIIAVLFFSSSDSPAGWWRALQRAWGAWLALGVVVGLYAGAYLLGDFFVETPRPDLQTVERALGDGWLNGFVPSLLGGPLEFRWIGSLGAPDPPLWLVVIDQILVVVLVGVTITYRRFAWRGFSLVLVAFLLNAGAIAWTRAGLFGRGRTRLEVPHRHPAGGDPRNRPGSASLEARTSLDAGGRDGPAIQRRRDGGRPVVALVCAP